MDAPEKIPKIPYRERVGTPSFISQVALAAWTALCGLVFVVMIGSALTHDYENDKYPFGLGRLEEQAARAKAAAVGTSFFCPGVSWLTVALPLGIVALVTARRK